jgi:hypothetical protein
MSWDDCFDRADEYDVTVSEVCDRLTEVRDARR